MRPTHATITSLHIYPVKSCRGIALATAELTSRGLAHDREWMVVDAEGQFLTQRALPRMALIETALTSDTLRLTATGQSDALELSLARRDRPRCCVRVWRDDCAALDEGSAAAGWLSAFLGKAVRLVRFDPAHRRLSDPQWTHGVDAENHFSDGYPLLVIGEESLEDLNSRLDVPLPMNRFRPNIVIRGLGPHGEDDAHALRGDGFEIRLVKLCERCSITTTDQTTAAVGKEPLRTLAAYRRDATLGGVTFGMNGIVTACADIPLNVRMRLTAHGATDSGKTCPPMNDTMKTTRKITLIAALLLVASAVQAQESKPAPAAKTVSAPKLAFPNGSPDEPLLKALSLAKAAESLDRTAVAWVQKNKCGSCHTGWPYLMSRAVLKDEPSPALTEIRKFFEGRMTNWDADEQVKKHQHREIVGTSTALAIHDAQTSGKLQPVTREALDRMWTLQRKDGAWSWPKCSWPPFEVDDYYGALLAAVGVGQAPENYAQSDSAKAGVDKLRGYFKATPAPNLHHKAWLLWASVKLDGLLSPGAQQTTIKELLALQRDDSGWSMESLGKGWVGREGEQANPDAPSDGYGTGLVVYVLRQAGVPASDPSIQRGKAWLSANQRESGRWFTRSLNGVEQHFISDTATVFAVLALKACE